MADKGTAGVNRQITLASRPNGLPDLANFRMTEAPIPVPSAGQVLVRTTHLSIDPYLRPAMDDPVLMPTDALVPGDAVGRVVASRHGFFRAGDFVHGMLGWQDYAAAPWYVLRKLDPAVAPVSTALGILGAPGLTAYVGLFEVARVTSKDTVVVSAAAGAVGSAAAQLATLVGCRVIGIAGSDEKVRYLRDELGIDAAVNYKTAGAVGARLGALAPFRVDVYFDNVGGDVSDAVARCLKIGARVAVCGQISEYNRAGPPAGRGWLDVILERRATVQGFLVTDFVARFPEALWHLSAWFRAGQLKYRETIEHGLENAPRAFIGMLEGRNVGKQLVRLEGVTPCEGGRAPVKRAIALGDVQTTSLIPLYSRAVETRSGGSLLRDPKSVAIVETMDYDFLQFDDAATVMGCVLRTAMFDEWVGNFMAAHPDGTVIEIGAGLSTRFDRLDNGRTRWVDLDLPDTMRLRRQFFADSARRTSVVASVLDENWCGVVQASPRPHFLVAEGVFVYLREDEVRRALALIARHLPDARVAFDTAGRSAVDASRRQGVLTEIKARLSWACDDPRDVEHWEPGYRLLESRSLVDPPAVLERRLPFSYRYWMAVLRLLRPKETDAYRLNLYEVRQYRGTAETAR